MRRRLALLATLLLAGCLGPAATREETFRFVEVRTDLRVEDDGRAGICGFPATPVVDEANRTVTFPGDWPGRDYGVLLLLTTWHGGGCGTVTSGFAVSHAWGGTLEGHGRAFEMMPDGSLRIGERVLQPGGRVAWSEEGAFEDGRAWTANVTVRDHGEWPREGIQRAA